jgi:hypothetical protein
VDDVVDAAAAAARIAHARGRDAFEIVWHIRCVARNQGLQLPPLHQDPWWDDSQNATQRRLVGLWELYRPLLSQPDGWRRVTRLVLCADAGLCEAEAAEERRHARAREDAEVVAATLRRVREAVRA